MGFQPLAAKHRPTAFSQHFASSILVTYKPSISLQTDHTKSFSAGIVAIIWHTFATQAHSLTVGYFARKRDFLCTIEMVPCRSSVTIEQKPCGWSSSSASGGYRAARGSPRRAQVPLCTRPRLHLEIFLSCSIKTKHIPLSLPGGERVWKKVTAHKEWL